MEYKRNDPVRNKKTLITLDSEYVEGSGQFRIGEFPVVPAYREGIVEHKHKAGFLFFKKTYYRVNFGGYGIWYVNPALLKRRDDS